MKCTLWYLRTQQRRLVAKKAIKFTVGLQILYLVQQPGMGSNTKVISTRKNVNTKQIFFFLKKQNPIFQNLSFSSNNYMCLGVWKKKIKKTTGGRGMIEVGNWHKTQWTRLWNLSICGVKFLISFCSLISDPTPVYPGLENPKLAVSVCLREQWLRVQGNTSNCPNNLNITNGMQSFWKNQQCSKTRQSSLPFHMKVKVSPQKNGAAWHRHQL